MDSVLAARATAAPPTAAPAATAAPGTAGTATTARDAASWSIVTDDESGDERRESMRRTMIVVGIVLVLVTAVRAEDPASVMAAMSDKAAAGRYLKELCDRVGRAVDLYTNAVNDELA